jgi:hypothetical protein
LRSTENFILVILGTDDVWLVSHRYEYTLRKLDDLWEESIKEGLEINPSKTEEIRVNTIVKVHFRLKGKYMKEWLNFCYIYGAVAADGGASPDVNVRMQKARGSFCKLREMRLSASIRKDTKIKNFNVCVKFVLLYECE